MIGLFCAKIMFSKQERRFNVDQAAAIVSQGRTLTDVIAIYQGGK